MFNKKTAAAIAIGLLMFAMLVSGGCLGDSDKKTSAKTLVVTGEIEENDAETLKAQGVTLKEYSQEALFKERLLLVSDMEDLSEEQIADTQKMFAEEGDAAVSLYQPTAEDAEKLADLLGAEDSGLLNAESLTQDENGEDDDNAQLRIYTIAKDAEGNIYSYAQVQHGADSKYQLARNDDIRKEDTDAGCVWVKYNKDNDADTPYDVIQYELEEVEDTDGNYYNIKSENVIGKVADSAINIDKSANKITVTLNGAEYNCLKAQKKDYDYTLFRQGIELPEDQETFIDETEIPQTASQLTAAGLMTDSEQEKQADKTDMQNFASWLYEDRYSRQQTVASAYSRPKTMFEKLAAWAKETFCGTGVACADSEQQELFDVAWKAIGTVGSTFANLPGLNLSVTTAIASVHHFEGTETDGGDDYYYVKQSCVMNNGMEHRHWYQGGYYKNVKLPRAFGDHVKYWVGGAECDEFYLSNYGVNAELVGNLSYPNINCIQANPQAYNKETSHLTTHGWNIGASFHGGTAHDAPDVGIALSGGYKSEKSESYSTYDIECKLNNAHNIISWKYPVTKTPHRGSPWTQLTHPADLAISTYQPAQAFIWQVKTANRNSYSDLRNIVSALAAGAYSRNSGSIRERHYERWIAACGNIRLPKPPLFCIDKSTVNFDETTAKTAYITIYSQGKWDWDKTTVPDWLTLTYTEDNCQLTVVAQPNNTGSVRTATIKLQRGDGLEAWDNRTITVTQSPYSK